MLLNWEYALLKGAGLLLKGLGLAVKGLGLAGHLGAIAAKGSGLLPLGGLTFAAAKQRKWIGYHIYDKDRNLIYAGRTSNWDLRFAYWESRDYEAVPIVGNMQLFPARAWEQEQVNWMRRKYGHIGMMKRNEIASKNWLKLKHYWEDYVF